MTEGPLMSCLLRKYLLARSREAAKVDRNIVFFVPSRLRAQKSSVSRFIEHAA